MNLLAKLRPGAFGLLLAGLALSTMATSLFKSTQQGSAPANTKAAVNAAQVPTKADAEPEQATELTFHQYAIDTEIANLDKLVRKDARDRLDAGVTAEQVKGSLAQLGTPQTAEESARRLYLLRMLRTLEDSEPLPTVEDAQLPTVEGYRDAIGE